MGADFVISYIASTLIEEGLRERNPSGNIYNDHYYGSEPLFPNYMEDIHRYWLGFKPPTESELPSPIIKIDNFDVEPYAGLKYTIHTYNVHGQEIPIELGLLHHRCVIYAEGFDIQYSWTAPYPDYSYSRSDTSVLAMKTRSMIITGGEVISVNPCAYKKLIRFQVYPMFPYLNWFKTRSVTQTMNSTIDVFIKELDKLGIVKDQFKSMVDIRNMEANLVKS